MGKKIRDSVGGFYSSAAVKPVESLCCAASYSGPDVSHIPKEALDISYGCTSPVNAGSLLSTPS